MAAVASGCDALSIPSASAVAATNTSVLTYSGQGGGFVSGQMTIFGGYACVVSKTDIGNFNNAGVGVCLFLENDVGEGPQGSLGYSPVDAEYFTYDQGLFDGTWVKNGNTPDTNYPIVVGGSWATTRPVFFTTDFSSTSANSAAITAYFHGVSVGMGGSTYVGMYGNAGTLEVIRTAGYATYFWQNESLGEWNNGSHYAYGCAWQVYNGGQFTLSNGDADVDGDYFFNTALQATGDYGQNTFNGTPPPPPVTPVGKGPITTTNPSVTGSSFSQATTLVIGTPENNYDKVLFSTTTSGSISNTPGFYELTPLDNPTNQIAYPIGIYSWDGGVTWDDIGQLPFGTPGDVAIYLYGKPVIIWPTVEENQIIINCAVGSVVPGYGANLGIQLKLALVAGPSPTPIDQFTLDQTVAYSSNILSSNYTTYRRIDTDAVLPGNSSQSLNSILHGLDEVPNFLYAEVTDTAAAPPQAFYSFAPGGNTSWGLYMDTEYIYYRVTSGSGADVAYRTYKDNT